MILAILRRRYGLFDNPPKPVLYSWLWAEELVQHLLLDFLRLVKGRTRVSYLFPMIYALFKNNIKIFIRKCHIEISLRKGKFV